MRKAALAAMLVACVTAGPALARIPPYAVDPREGVWIGGGEVFIKQTSDRWAVFSAGANVNKLVVDDRIVWLATDDGVIRFDSGSFRSTKLTMDDGLPSQVVKGVAADDQFVWFATNKGLVRYRKLDRTIKVYTDQEGLPHRAANDVLAVGRQVWVATRGGIAVYSPEVDGLRAFTEKDGLAWGDVLELFQVGDDLWCRTEEGLSRFRIKTRVFSNFSKKELGAEQLRTFTLDGDSIWVGTDNGLMQFQSASDHVLPFRQQAALEGKVINGVEVFTDYLFITTDKEVVQYNKLTRAIRRYTEADGLARREGAIGTLMAGGLYTVVFPDGAQVYNAQRDLWAPRELAVTQQSESQTKINLFGKFDGSTPYDFVKNQFGSDRYATAQGGFGFGQRLENGRQLNGSMWLDYGQVENSGIRDLQYKIEYLGNERDVLREVRVEDKLKYRYKEEGLERPLLLQGARVQLSTPGAEPAGKVEAHAGFRRGVVVRDFLTGPRQDLYQLSKRYIIAGSERVYVDGELLTNGVDYTIIYTSGQLAFLNPERIDDLSVVSVEYEYDLMPKKDLGNLSVLDMLPADREVGDWTRSGDPQLVAQEAGLYNQIDGAAPKYIDRGWARSVYADFRQGSRNIKVAIHDMASDENAESIWRYDLPPSRTTINNRENVVLDMSLTAAYATKAHTGRFYIELSIDEKSDAAKESIRLFTIQILDRKEKAGAGMGDPWREWLVSERISGRPVGGLELGARTVNTQQTGVGTDGAVGRKLITGVVDERFERALPGGGLFTSYSEVGGSHRGDVMDKNGYAAMSMMRISHPSLEGSVTGRVHSQDYSAIGTDATRFGKLRDEVVLNATGYPTRWMPATVFFTRQSSFLADRPGTSNVTHALARLQVNHEKYPSASIQVGKTLLESLGYFDTDRIQVVGQTEYDLARPLAFTGIKRFNIRALYSMSEAATDMRRGLGTNQAAVDYTDRVQLTRLEGKLSPTSTESIYGLFRSRVLDREQRGSSERILSHWELYSGAQSAAVRGLLPQANYTVTYDDTRLAPVTTTLLGTSSTTPSTTTTPFPSTTTTPTAANPATSPAPLASANGIVSTTAQQNPALVMPPGPGTEPLIPSTRTAKTTIGGALGIYPGEWWKPASPVVIEPRISVSNDEKADDIVKTLFRREYRVDNRAVYASAGPVEVELYQLYQVSVTDQDQHTNATRMEIRNRFVYRPLVISPITLRLNYMRTQSLNATDAVTAGAGAWATQSTYETILDWLMRWNKYVTTRPRATVSLGKTDDFPFKDKTTGLLIVQNYQQWRAGAELELRFFPLEDSARLYLVQRDGVFRMFGDGTGALEAVQFYFGAGAIYRMADNLYLDTEWTYRQTSCFENTCLLARSLEPRLLLTMNF